MQVKLEFYFHDVFFEVEGDYINILPSMDGPGFQEVKVAKMHPRLSKHNREDPVFVDGFNAAMIKAAEELVYRESMSRSVIQEINKRDRGVK